MLDFENNNNPNEITRDAISEWKKISNYNINETKQILLNSEKIESYGIDGKDAIHIACAIEWQVEIFFTTDNDIIKNGKNVKDVKILNPVQYFTEFD